LVGASATAAAAISFVLAAKSVLAIGRQRRNPGPGRTAVLGDSFTAAPRGFVSYLNQALPGRSFVPFGIIGQGSTGIKNRLQPQAIGRGFDEIIIEAGINDIRRHDAVLHITRNLAEMVATAKRAGLKVVLLTLPPWHQAATKIARANRIILANGKRWGADVVVDIHKPLSTPQGHLKQDLVGDRVGLHPNRAGHELLGSTIVNFGYR